MDRIYWSDMYRSDTTRHQSPALMYVGVGIMNVHMLKAGVYIDRLEGS
jgi:hypothetical protein